MTILNPISATNLFVQSSTAPGTTAEERQVDLRPEQVVRATVVEGGQGRVLMELDHRQYRTQSEVALQAGQKLTLQVLQTQPQLEFRVINDPLAGKYGQMMPLLAKPYDWAGLLAVLRQQSQPLGTPGLPTSTTQVYQQLQQLLQPNGPLPATLEAGLVRLPAQLQQLFLSLAAGQGQWSPPAAAAEQTAALLRAAGPESTIPQLLRGLQGQLAKLQASGADALPPAWLAETAALLGPLPHSLKQAPLPLTQGNDLLILLVTLRKQFSLPTALAAQLELSLSQLKAQRGEQLSAAQQLPGQSAAAAAGSGPVPGSAEAAPTLPLSSPMSPEQKNLLAGAGTASPAGLYRSSAASAAPLPAPPGAAVPPSEIGAGLQQLLTEVQRSQGTGPLAPELLGRLEGLLDKLQQLPAAAASGQAALPGMELLTRQLSLLLQQGVQTPRGEQLGFLSQLFGFRLEADLLAGKKRDVLASLKTSLLMLQKELGQEAEEPLRRLEMYQLCKARLAEEQQQFLPLPFNELEEGYLLLEQPEAEQAPTAERPVQLSLSLRLSALGNMRVDMLYEKKGLHLRIACEDQEKMAYLQDRLPELEQAIETVALHGVSFSTDAELPTRQLLERLRPDAVNLLDARI